MPWRAWNPSSAVLSVGLVGAFKPALPNATPATEAGTQLPASRPQPSVEREIQWLDQGGGRRITERRLLAASGG
jgi:hypothetical protein